MFWFAVLWPWERETCDPSHCTSNIQRFPWYFTRPQYFWYNEFPITKTSPNFYIPLVKWFLFTTWTKLPPDKTWRRHCNTSKWYIDARYGYDNLRCMVRYIQPPWAKSWTDWTSRTDTPICVHSPIHPSLIAKQSRIPDGSYICAFAQLQSSIRDQIK